MPVNKYLIIPVDDSFMLLKDIYSIPTSDYNRNLEELTELLHGARHYQSAGS